VADVEKAFQMVSVTDSDRDMLRFLWVDDVNKALTTIMQMQYTRVVFDVSTSPFLLNATIYHHLQQYRDIYPDLVSTLTKSIYVDDVTYGAEGEEEAYKLYVLSTKVFAEGGFNLQKFATNSPTLHQRIASYEQISPADLHSNSSVIEEDATYTSDLLTGSGPSGQKVLGISWNPISDVLEFDVRQIAISLYTLTPTKHKIASFASRFYDPLGFLPVVVMLKFLFQELCKLKLDRDGSLPSELLSRWTGLDSRVLLLSNRDAISLHQVNQWQIFCMVSVMLPPLHL